MGPAKPGDAAAAAAAGKLAGLALDESDEEDDDGPWTMHVWVVEEIGGNERWDSRWVLHDPEKNIHEGDVVTLPELCTGGGDFEHLFFAGARRGGDRVPLVRTGDVEVVVFPGCIKRLCARRGTDVVAAYRRAMDHVCEDQGFSLDDLYGGAENEMIAEWLALPENDGAAAAADDDDDDDGDESGEEDDGDGDRVVRTLEIADVSCDLMIEYVVGEE